MNASRSYIYAKACGIISKSFIEGRESRLLNISSIAEFNAAVFGGARSAGSTDSSAGLSGAAKDISPTALERSLITKTVGEILLILKAYTKAPYLLVRLIKSYEYADLKNALAAIHANKPAPEIVSLGRWTGIDWGAYPNLKKMISGRCKNGHADLEYGFLLETSIEKSSDVEIQATLDKRYYSLLLAALRELPHSEVPRFAHILTEEISLANCSWALRLRSYYEMSAKAVSARLIDESLAGGKYAKSKSLASDAKKSLSLALDHRAEWENWRRIRFLNPEPPASYWKCDPRYFQHHASVYLYKLARSSFRRNPWTLDTAACFIRLKQFEEQLLCGVAEGLALGVSANESLGIMGVAQ